MTRTSLTPFGTPALALWLALHSAAAAAPQQVMIVSAKASSEVEQSPVAKAIDGNLGDNSRWVSRPSPKPAWLELDLGAEQNIAGLHVFSGYQERDPLQDFVVQFWDGMAWQDVPSAKFTGNTSSTLEVAFDDALVVKTSRLRLWITASHQNVARVKEVVVWAGASGDIPAIPEATKVIAQASIIPLYLNQSGFDLGKPKRFTAPTLADGTPFVVRALKGGDALFRGVVKGNKGDFTAFDPAGETEYVVEAGGLTSVPFRIGMWWLERVTYQNAIDFMIDSRNFVGNVRDPAKGSYGWRDDHHFGWELHSLVPQLLSNPSAYERMPRQIRYEKPGDSTKWGALEPYPDDAPDLVKLIHWGADVIVSQKTTHEMLKTQLAYFLYAWPVLKQWLPEQNLEVVSQFAFRHWAEKGIDQKYSYDESPEHNLLALKTKVGTTKGSYPPGFSIQPNLMMHEEAKRLKRPDAPAYLKAAVDQAAWIVKELDWNDPLTTKGQRMSEFITVTGLAYLLKEYPAEAPKGLAEKIDAWAAVAVRRADNMWDFRKLDDGDQWTPTGPKPQMWNEVGNVTGFPSVLIAAREFVKDSAVRKRMDELVWSHFDNMFGRNPVGRHFSYDAPREIEGVEHGWFSFYRGGLGQLSEARFVLDGSPKNQHYPWNPKIGNTGWTEGWIQFNTAFDTSLAYLAWSDTKVEITREGADLRVKLLAPLNFDYGKVETAKVTITSSTGDTETVTVTEDSVNSATFSGTIRLDATGTARPGDGVIQAVKGGEVKAAYGYGYLGREAKLEP